MNDASLPQRVADRLAIQDALARYCRAIDRQELELLSEVFHDDARIANGHFEGSPADFVAMVRERHAKIPKASHMVTTVLIDFTGATGAFVESYGLALEYHPHGKEGPVDRIVRVRYGDEFEQRAGHWKVARRIVVMDHEMSVPSSAGGSTWSNAGRLEGARSTADPVSQRRIALGLLHRH